MSAKTKAAPKKKKADASKRVPQFLFDLASAEPEAKSDPVVVERIAVEFVGAIHGLSKLDPDSRLVIYKRITKAMSALSKKMSVAVFDRRKNDESASPELPLTEATLISASEPKELF